MIENLRKYTGIIILFMALVVVSLVIGIKDDALMGGIGGRGVIEIDGRTYNDKEYSNLGSGAFDLTGALARAGDFGLYQFMLGLTAGASDENQAAEKFFINRILLRKAKEEFGVHPGEQEVSDYIRNMRAFAGPDGKFNETTYRSFIEKGIGRLGMTEADLRELAIDALASQKINSILGAGLSVNRDLTARMVALDDLKVSGSIARLDIDPFSSAITPTDEEIKAYWENIQDAFTTQPRRRFTYIIATPNMPADDSATEEKESIAEAAATEEGKKALEAKKAEEKAKKAAELAEQRRKIQNETDSKIDDFTFQLEEQKGTGFEELAKENGWEVKTTELFTQSAPPAGLDVTLRASSRGGKAVDELFRIELTTDPISKLSQPIAIGENQWLVARLDEVEPSRAKTFEEAKDDARAQFIQEKATEKMKAAAEEAVTKIKEAMAAGKTFAEAAQAAGITQTHEFTKVSVDYSPDATKEPRTLLTAVRSVDPGSIAEVVTEADRAFIIHVATREVEKKADGDSGIEAKLTSAARTNETAAYSAWLAERVEAANVKRLYEK